MRGEGERGVRGGWMSERKRRRRRRERKRRRKRRRRRRRRERGGWERGVRGSFIHFRKAELFFFSFKEVVLFILGRQNSAFGFSFRNGVRTLPKGIPSLFVEQNNK